MRKTVTLLVTVTVPKEMPMKQVRLEVRTLISEWTTYSADPDDIKVKGVRSAPRPKKP